MTPARIPNAGMVLDLHLILQTQRAGAEKSRIMPRAIAIILLVLLPLAVVAQVQSAYQIATIVSVKPHQTSSTAAPDSKSYDVTLRVSDLELVVLATPPEEVGTIKYAAGRQVLILVGDKTITYHDLLGRSFDVPILSRTKIAASAQPQ
jgi:hypothetical protein